ncbi:MAG TPA: glycosyltransferase family 39 protein, partial [Chitinophagaceae bacterium]|nr:glycosyltransferase family 39 protein [Chitinophagaceae bacterium]
MPKPVLIFFYLLVAGLTLLVFYGFWQSPITLYDEAVYANNALEMSQGGHPFILTLDHAPTLYNTKPPLAIWLMAICIKIFGANEFAVRLPSVLAFVCLAIALTRFSKQYFNSIIPGIFSVIILLGSQGLMFTHGARTGDLDMLFVLFATLFVLSVVRLLVSDVSRVNKHLIWSGIYFLAAYFTKSTAIFLFIPGLLISLLLSQNRKYIVTKKVFYLVPLASLLIIACYYWMMDKIFPGYTSQVFFSEYKRAYANIMPWHKRPFGWYFDNLFHGRFTPYVYAVIPAIIIGCIVGKGIVKRVVVLLSIVSLSYLLFISFVPDKLEWYDIPVYPLFTLLIGIALYELLKRTLSPNLIPIIASACCLLI